MRRLMARYIQASQTAGKDFVVLGESTPGGKPGERALHDPTPLEDREAARADLLPIHLDTFRHPDTADASPGMFHDLTLPSEDVFDPLAEAAFLVPTLGPDECRDAGSSLSAAQAAIFPHGNPGCWPQAPARAAGTHWYRPADGACALSRVCRRQSLAAPFVTRFHGLAVDESGAGGRLTSVLDPRLCPQRCVDTLPGAIMAK